MKNLYITFVNTTKKLKDIPPIVLRFILAYGFWEPAINKVNNLNSTGDWFSSLGYPAPLLMAYLAGITEIAGVFLLILGLGTRLISIPLMITMLVAIFTVHWANGFSVSNNGIEIPLYYFIMLLTLLIIGPGRASIDHFIKIGNKKD